MHIFIYVFIIRILLLWIQLLNPRNLKVLCIAHSYVFCEHTVVWFIKLREKHFLKVLVTSYLNVYMLVVVPEAFPRRQ